MVNLVALRVSRGEILNVESEEEEQESESPQEVEDFHQIPDDPPDSFDDTPDDSDAELIDSEQMDEDDVLNNVGDDDSDNDEVYSPDRLFDRDGGANKHFTASNQWRRGFMHRCGFSIRTPHPKRRPMVDDERRAAFVQGMIQILTTLPPAMVLNMDETSWKLINHQIGTVADIGTEGISCLFDGDPKTCLTAIATISAAGEKLPLWIIAKGKTARCETRYHRNCTRAIADGKLKVTHQPAGWVNSDVAKEYLKWLAESLGHPFVLLWDLFSAREQKPQLRSACKWS
jgi:hypothetical protein